MARRQDVLLTDEQWQRIKPLIPQPRKTTKRGSPAGG
jgi:hypothetical protein